MVKAFDNREKELIHSTLLDKGRELFGRYGLKKTSIKELTEAVGISQGSFYKFFNSKEELYFEIMEQEEEALKQDLIVTLFQSGKSAKEGFREMLKEGIQLAMDSPFIKRMFLEEEYNLLIRKLPEDRVANHHERDTDTLLPLVTQWQKEGMMVECEPEIISGVIRSIFLVALHKKEIGEEHYTATLELLIDLVTDGLFVGH